MSKEISKSPEMIQKEEMVLSLQKQIKKTRSTLKGLKTRLANTQQEISDVQRKFSGRYFDLMLKLDEIRQEIIASLKKLKKLKNLLPEEKKQVEMLAEEMIEEGMGKEFEALREKKAKMESGEFDFDENQRAKMRDLFAEFKVQPDEIEQRNIRKVFIKLSTHFHTDKAKNKKEAEIFHGLMQEINEAYQQGDIDRLLELERLNLETEMIDFQSKAITVDMLQQEINRLEIELDHLKNQIERTRIEIKQLRKSDLGKMLTDINKADREGHGMDEAIVEMEQSLEHMTTLKEALAKAENEGNLIPLYESMISEIGEDSPFADLGLDTEEGMEMINSMREMFEEFGMDDYDGYEEIENPKFKIGSSVKLKTENRFKGWVGRVSQALRDDEGEEIYVIDFDSITISQYMTSEFIIKLIEGGEDFSEYEASPNELETCKPRDTKEEALAAHRTAFHKHRWNDLGKKEKDLMFQIMTNFPEKTDEENWEIYFKNTFQFPVEAISRGIFNFPKNTKIELTAPYVWDERGGMLAMVKLKGDFVRDHPILDFEIKGKKGQSVILDIYYIWATEIL